MRKVICNIGDMSQIHKHLEMRSEVNVKVKVNQKWYATLRHPKKNPHTKFWILTSNDIGDICSRQDYCRNYVIGQGNNDIAPSNDASNNVGDMLWT